MSKCMTIADKTIDQKDICTEFASKDIVEFILDEALHSALDKGCSRIGDFNIRDDFCQQYDRQPNLKYFEQVNLIGNPSAANQDLNANTERSADRSGILGTEKENLETIIDSFVKKEEKSKPLGGCTILSAEILADNELQIQNGQSFIEKNKNDKNLRDAARREYFSKKDVIKDEKIEIEYYHEKKLNKIYVPLTPSAEIRYESPSGLAQTEMKDEEAAKEKAKKEDEPNLVSNAEERPFKPFTTEELRQVWGNINSSLVGRWDGDVSVQREEVGKLMEELSTLQVYSDGSTDPNRPRACAFGEEDVKKIIKEIEEINFNQNHTNAEEFDLTYHPDGQGDADLESKSFTKSKDNLGKSPNNDKPQDYSINSPLPDPKTADAKNINEIREEQEQEIFSSGKVVSTKSKLLSSDKMVPKTNPHVCPEIMDLGQSNQYLPDSEQGPKTEAGQCSSDTISALAISVNSEAPPDDESSVCNETKTPVYNIEEKHSFHSNLTEEKNSRNWHNYKSTAETEKKTKDDLKDSLSDDERFTKDLNNIKDYHKVLNVSEDSAFWSTRSWTDSKQDDFSKRNLELSSEIDLRSPPGRRSDLLKGSRSASDTPDNSTVLNLDVNQHIVSARNMHSINDNAENLIRVNSFATGMSAKVSEPDRNGREKNGSETISRESYSLAVSKDSGTEICENLDYSDVIGEEMNERLQHVLICSEKDNKFENFQKGFSKSNNDLETESKQESLESTCFELTASVVSEESQKSLCESRKSDSSQSNDEPSVSSETQVSVGSSPENEASEDSDAVENRSQKFKLHSQKMYHQGTPQEPDNKTSEEFILTESEEAFITATESVIQVIEPPENSGDEEPSKISFSLLSELSHERYASCENESTSELSLKNKTSSENKSFSKKVYSGMSTIGPIKNLDYDPKDLSAPDIDYGKMTRITSSRQIAKDLFNSELTKTGSLRNIDSDDEFSLNAEEDPSDLSSLINRDIASLTKVQKVREVMSHQPKLEDDFEDEDAFPRPRLDLKDVESMTDERYKVPDVSIPFLSVGIGESNSSAEKELIESMGRVLSGLINPSYYEEDPEEINEVFQKDQIDGRLQIIEYSKKNSVTTEIPAKDSNDTTASEEINTKTEASNETGEPEKNQADLQSENCSGFSKYGTLGNVFKKASNKFIRKDSDPILRNSKSLPRDPSEIGQTDSIRSMIDECQSSATFMLKKSKSLLKNTQSIFKCMKDIRGSSSRGSGHCAEKQKLSPSESDVSTLERKLSSFLKKEDFLKPKNLIKSKVEKAFKNFDSGNSSSGEKSSRDSISPDSKDLQVAIRDEEKLRVDRMENFKKLLPKSPMVYKSQFVRSQINVQSSASEEAVANREPTEEEQIYTERNSSTFFSETTADETSEEVAVKMVEGENLDTETHTETIISPKEKRTAEQKVLNIAKELELSTYEVDYEQPDYIVMETIQALPAVELETQCKKETSSLKMPEKIEIETEKDFKKTEASNSMQTLKDEPQDVAPCFPEIDEDRMTMKTPSERKIKSKKKKFTARFRSFWCSAFGRVKTSSKKGELP